MEQLTRFEDLDLFYKNNPSALPQNNGRTFWPSVTTKKPNWGFSPGDSSKVCCANSDETLMLVREFDTGYLGVYSLTDKKFLGSIPLSLYNGLDIGMNVRWDRSINTLNSNWLVFTQGTNIKSQKWNDPSTAIPRISSPNGYVFIDNGGDGDLSDDGRFYPVMLSTGYSSGHWQNVQTGVADLTTGKLSALISGKPDAIDISPDGKWFFWCDGLGLAINRPNRVFSIEQLFSSPITSGTPIDSTISNGNQQLGHNGWARLAAGHSALVYTDHQDDYIKYYNPKANKSIKVISALNLGYPNIHFSRHAPMGYTIASTYGSAVENALSNSIFLIELTTGKTSLIAQTYNQTTGKNNEAAAQTSWISAKNVYWASNTDGLSNLETYRAAVTNLQSPSPSLEKPQPSDWFELETRAGYGISTKQWVRILP